jgi:hypothetical protein
VFKIWTPLQTTWGKEEQNIVSMRILQPSTQNVRTHTRTTQKLTRWARGISRKTLD